MPAEALAKVYFRDDADWRDDNEEISQIFVSGSRIGVTVCTGIRLSFAAPEQV
jgi:hypothetical protein